MLLAELAATSRRVAETSSRLEKIGTLAATLRKLDRDEIEIGVAFLSGELSQGRIGVGGALLRETPGSPRGSEATLTLTDADRQFEAIAATRGAGSAAERAQRLKQLFGAATAEEQDFLVRLIVGELRQGALEGIMFEAIARASGLAAAEIRQAAMLTGDLRMVAKAALLEGAAGLARFAAQLFSPMLPMLSQSSTSVGDAMRQLRNPLIEWKLDGARVQAHKRGTEVRLYTRNLKDVSERLPEIIERVRDLPAIDAILDGEVIALQADHRPHPFQITLNRFGRKLNVAQMRETLPLNVFFFDLLYFNGGSLIGKSTRERVTALDALLPPELTLPRLATNDAGEAERFFQDALAHGHEGVMVKDLDAPYQAGRRGSAWVKVKQTKSLDLVVLAAEWGHGRRRGWLSNLHLGARDSENGGFVMLGKTFKGMTDEMLAQQTAKLLSLEASRDPYTVCVRPELVVEITFNELQTSTQYPGGLALRFARVKRYREDKTAADADSIQTARAIFKGGDAP